MHLRFNCGFIASMDSTNTPRSDADLLREAALLAWEQCLRENGLAGAMGCAHIAVDAARAFVAEFNKTHA